MVEEEKRMKRLIPTLILLILCIAGFWYAKDHNLFKDTSKKEPEKLAIIASKDVQGFSIKDESGTIELVKKGEDWQILKPAAYAVSTYGPGTWVDSFAGLTFENKIDDNPKDLAGFGLAQPVKEYQVTMKDGTVRKLLVGKPLPVPGTTYVKLGDSNTVYEVNDNSLTPLNKTTTDFVDLSAVKMRYDKIKSVEMKWKGQSWKLDKAQADKSVYDTTWKLGAKDLDANGGSAILDKMLNLTAQELPKSLSELPVTSPELTLSITQTDQGKETTNVFLGKVDGEQIHIVQQGDNWVYTIPAQDIQDLFDKAPK